MGPLHGQQRLTLVTTMLVSRNPHSPGWLPTLRSASSTHLLVVVQDDNHVGVQEAGVVHRLIRHASGDSTVTDDL